MNTTTSTTSTTSTPTETDQTDETDMAEAVWEEEAQLCGSAAQVPADVGKDIVTWERCPRHKFIPRKSAANTDLNVEFNGMLRQNWCVGHCCQQVEAQHNDILELSARRRQSRKLKGCQYSARLKHTQNWFCLGPLAGSIIIQAH